jgi:putative acetyltransferase
VADWAVRPERADEAAAVHGLTGSAFGRELEADLVDALRRAPEYIPELSLVAATEHAAIGHVMLTRLWLADGETRHDALVLAPLSVVPEWQRKGVGSALVRRALADAAAAGHRLVVLMGSRHYYPRFGFEPSAPHGVIQPFGTGPDAQVHFLDPAARGVVRGRVEYPPSWYSVPGIMPS